MCRRVSACSKPKSGKIDVGTSLGHRAPGRPRHSPTHMHITPPTAAAADHGLQQVDMGLGAISGVVGGVGTRGLSTAGGGLSTAGGGLSAAGGGLSTPGGGLSTFGAISGSVGGVGTRGLSTAGGGLSIPGGGVSTGGGGLSTSGGGLSTAGGGLSTASNSEQLTRVSLVAPPPLAVPHHLDAWAGGGSLPGGGSPPPPCAEVGLLEDGWPDSVLDETVVFPELVEAVAVPESGMPVVGVDESIVKSKR